MDEAGATVGEEEHDEQPGEADPLGEVGHGHDAGAHPGADHDEGGTHRCERGAIWCWVRHQSVATST